MVVTQGLEKRRLGNYCLMGTEFQFGKMGKFLEMDGGDGYMIVLMFKMVNFMFCIIYYN